MLGGQKISKKERSALGAMPIDVGDEILSLHVDQYYGDEVKIEVIKGKHSEQLWIPASLYDLLHSEITAEYKLSERVLKESRDRWKEKALRLENEVTTLKARHE